jgi:hypothetical protein
MRLQKILGNYWVDCLHPPHRNEGAVRQLGYRVSPLIALVELVLRDAPDFVERTRAGLSGRGV